MVFVVVSFAFGLSSDVKLHYLGGELVKAEKVYALVEKESLLRSQEEHGAKLLVDLLDVEEGVYEAGYTCFWPRRQVEGVTTLRTNNA